MHDILDVLKALSDETRLRLVCALRGGELCVCQLIALIDLAPSTVSKHLSILRAARLVESRKDGRWIYYRLAEVSPRSGTGRLLPILFQSLGRTGCIAGDRRRLKEICAEGTGTLCRRLFGKP